jgi:hypothetical protein
MNLSRVCGCTVFVFVSEAAGAARLWKPVHTELSPENRQLNWFNQSNLRRNGRELSLWRSDRGNLVADQLPAGLRFCEDDAALELAAGGFAAVLTFDCHATYRDRYVSAVNPDFHVRIRFDGAEFGGPRFLVGQALCLSKNRAAGVDEGVIVRPNPFERGGIPLRQGGAILFDRSADFLFRSFVVGRTRGLG